MQNIEIELDKEINLYTQIVECSKAKKEILIKSDIEGLKMIDEKLNALNRDLSKLISKRDKNLRLKDLVESLKDRDIEAAKRIEGKRKNIENIFLDLQQTEKINKKLITTSLKLVEKTLSMFASFLIPETASYNTRGRSKINKEIVISSVIEEA